MMRVVRQDALVMHLRTSGPASVPELAEVLGASPATVRRDLEQLAAAGALERTWGGARLASTEDDPFAEASLNQSDAKRTIAELAVAQVPEGATVIIDIGTTTHYAASLLRGRELTVITASLPVFEVLRDAPGVQLVLLGGEHSPRYQCLGGSMTADSVARFSPDIALLGCSGLTERGQVRDTSNGQVAVKQAIGRSATRRLLLADHSKFPGHGSEVALTLDDVDLLVTDQPLAEPLEACCQRFQTKVLQP